MPAAKPAIEFKFSLDTLPKPLDAKLGGGAVAKMKGAGEAAIKKSGKAVVGKPTGADGIGYTLSGKLTVLAPDGSGRKLNGKITVNGMMVGKSAKTATITSAAFVDIRGADKVTAANVDDLAEALADAAMQKFLGSL
jgi:hypothetical protein